MFEAIVLRATDVGEADRFMILFSREAGRMSVRAKAVRKPQSRLGSCLLPLKHVKIECAEHRSGLIITGATDAGSEYLASVHHVAFSRMQQGVELLLKLTHDGEPMPAVFTATLSLFTHAAGQEHAPLAYSLLLLFRLGLLPEGEELRTLVTLSAEEEMFLAASKTGQFGTLTVLPSAAKLQKLVTILLSDQLTSPLKAPQVAKEMQD
jgi:DNA repair protein RecO (recombination protein O)